MLLLLGKKKGLTGFKLTNSLPNGFGFSRTSIASNQDFENSIESAKIQEVRFTGNRRIENLYLQTETLATQSNTVISGDYTVRFAGTGTITFSGAYSGSLVGQGSNIIVSKKFTVTTGTLTSTVSGSVLKAQLENVTGKSNQNPSEYVATNIVPTPTTDNYWRAVGLPANYCWTPDTVQNSIIGDIDIIVCLANDTWGSGVIQSFISKYNTAGNQRSFIFGADVNGYLALYIANDGTVASARTATVKHNIANYEKKWVRSTVDVDNGSGSNTTRFYTSNDGVNWTQLGANITSPGIFSFYDSNSSLEIGSVGVGTTYKFAGKIYRAILKNGINGTVVADFDSTRFTANYNNATMISSVGENWTMATTGYNTTYARITNDSYINYDGACVDGVRYVNYQNGNTVDLNGVVSESTGTLLASNGVKIEQGSTNLLLQSSTAGTTPWTVNNLTATLSSFVTKVQGVYFRQLTEDNTNSLHYNAQPITVVNGSKYTFSRIYKYNGRNIRHSFVTGNSANGCYIDVNLQNGTIVNSGALGTGTYISSKIINLGDGSYFVSVTGTIQSTAGFEVTTLRNALTNVLTEAEQNYTGNGVSGVYANIAQKELGPIATSYIPTTTATVSRVADSLFYDFGIGLMPQQFSLIMDITPSFNWSLADDSTISLFSTYDNRASYTNIIKTIGSGSYSFYLNGSGTPIIQINKNDFIENTTYRVGISFAQEAGNIRAVLAINNVVKINSALAGTLDHGNQGKLYIGSFYPENWSFGNYKNIKIYNKPLSSSNLASLTKL